MEEKVKCFEYPKTYAECCNILMGETNFQDYSLVLTKLNTNVNEENSISPHITLINNFSKILICRDAYWKIAGNWKPDWEKSEQPKFGLYTFENEIRKIKLIVLKNLILVFPTEEMCDAFYDNFKDLIEMCKTILQSFHFK